MFPSTSNALNTLISDPDFCKLYGIPLHFAERGSLIFIYGTGGSGKTNICLDVAFNAKLDWGAKVLYLDTEKGVSPERLCTMMTARKIDPKKYLTVNKNGTFEFSLFKIRLISDFMELLKQKDFNEFDLIIIDSVVEWYENNYVGSPNENKNQNNMMTTLGKIILETMSKTNCSVIFTGHAKDPITIETEKQQQTLSESEKMRTLQDKRLYTGGKPLEYNPKFILRTIKKDGAVRVITPEKHRNRETGTETLFMVTNWGVGDVGATTQSNTKTNP